MLFLDTLWPDFGEADLERAVRDFICRDRRYGAVAVG
jgi:undecaprenyl diphosphate synthase